MKLESIVQAINLDKIKTVILVRKIRENTNFTLQDSYNIAIAIKAAYSKGKRNA